VGYIINFYLWYKLRYSLQGKIKGLGLKHTLKAVYNNGKNFKRTKQQHATLTAAVDNINMGST